MKTFYVFIPLFILLLSANLLIFNEDFYAQEAVDYENNQETISKLISFFKGGELNTDPYTSTEVLHLFDVQRLIRASVLVCSFLFLVLLTASLREDKQTIRKNLIKGGKWSLVLTGTLALTLLNFSDSFIVFHKILFTNTYWQLNADTILITMFPESFFSTAALTIILYSTIFSTVTIILGVKIPREDKT
jgi:integral membrane protein (TIGR01906 family)